MSGALTGPNELGSWLGNGDTLTAELPSLSRINKPWSTLFKSARYCSSQVFILCREAGCTLQGWGYSFIWLVRKDLDDGVILEHGHERSGG